MLSGTMEKLLYLAGGTPARTDDPLDDLETAEILFGLDLERFNIMALCPYKITHSDSK